MVRGFQGSTIYTYNALAGSDFIYDGYDRDGIDTLVFGPSLKLEDLSVTRSATDLDDIILSFANQAGSLTLDEQFAYPGQGYGVERFEFADGVTGDVEDLKALYLQQAQTAGDDLLRGFDGSTTYIFDALAGNDVIRDGYDPDATDVLAFGEGLDAADLMVTRPADVRDITLTFAGHSGSITLDQQFFGASYGIEEFRFADGTVWTIDDVVALLGQYGTEASDSWLEGGIARDWLYGLGGDDTLVGREGDDWLDGGNGYDQANYNGSSTDFLFNRLADGSVQISDTTGSEGIDTLVDIEAVYFAGDGVWSALSDLVAGYGTAEGDSWVEGTARSDNLYGLAGDDTLIGRGGDDQIDGGASIPTPAAVPRC